MVERHFASTSIQNRFSGFETDAEEADQEVAAPTMAEEDSDWLLQRIRNKKQQTRVKKNYIGLDGFGCGKDCKDLQRTAPVSSINGIAIDSGKTVEVNTIEGEKTNFDSLQHRRCPATARRCAKSNPTRQQNCHGGRRRVHTKRRYRGGD